MSNYDFIALDVETANEQYWSICQVGLAYFKEGQLVDQFESLVNPQTYFSDLNISIHGITEKDVLNSITLPEAYDILAQRLSSNIIAHHTHFDRSSCCRCADHTKKDYINCSWVDTSLVARDTWKEVKYSGYALFSLSKMLDIPFEHHHNALNDAIAAGNVLIRAHQTEKLPFDIYIKRFSRTLNEAGEVIGFNNCWNSSDIKLHKIADAEPNPCGPLFGEVIVFTGELTIPRPEAAEMAYKLGGNIDLGVTKKTTILVVGQQDLNLLAGHTKSSKHRRAEELILQGQNIRIMGENDFLAVFSGL